LSGLTPSHNRARKLRGKNPQGQYSIEGFADLGIAGLTDRKTVRMYRRAWQAAIDAGKAKAVEPGRQQRVAVPEMEWPGAAARNKRGRPAQPDHTARWLMKWLEDYSADLEKKAKAGLADDDFEAVEDGIPKVTQTLQRIRAAIKAQKDQAKARHMTAKGGKKAAVA
jgi:hypothetical protein